MPQDPPVVTVLTDLGDSDALLDRIRAAMPQADVELTPWAESGALRSLRSRHGGTIPDGVLGSTPDLTPAAIDPAARERWETTTVLLTIDLPRPVGELFPQLEWVQSVTAGIDHFDLDELRSLGVLLTTSSGVAAASMAEFVLGRILQEYKHFRTFDDQQREQVWQGRFGSELTGRTIAVVGFGAIGRAVARRAKAFDLEVLGVRASAQRGDTDPDADAMYPPSELDAVLARADIVVAALPSNPQTVGLFDQARFEAMTAGAMFINVGRGSHVDEPALIAALESGSLRAAALDVASVEPLPPGDPLWTAPNLYLSPHTSVSLDRYGVNIVDMTIDNLQRHLSGEPLINVRGR